LRVCSPIGKENGCNPF